MATQQQHRRSIIGTGAVLIALSGPGQTAGFSVFVDPLTENLDVTRGQLTFAYLLGTLAASTTGTWLGRVIDRRGVAKVVPGVALGLCLATVLASVSTHLVMLTVAIYGLRSFGQTGMPLAASVFVAKNVVHRRGAALGLLTALGGSTIALTPFIAARVIPRIGWQATWMLEGVVVVLMGLVMAGVIRRLRLEHPHVDDEEVINDVATTDEPRHLRRNGFLVVTFGYATTGFVSTALAFHQIAVLGERGLWYKMSTLDHSMRVPLVMAGPGIVHGVSPEPCSLVDLLPTFMDIATDGNAPEPVSPLDGHSLTGLLGGGDAGWDNKVISEYTGEGVSVPCRMVRRDHYKFIYTHGRPPLLYDLDQDPLEVENLAGRPEVSEIEARLSAEIMQDYDPEAVNEACIQSQKERLFIQKATDSIPSWAYIARAGDDARYVRNASAVGAKAAARYPFVEPTPFER